MFERFDRRPAIAARDPAARQHQIGRGKAGKPRNRAFEFNGGIAPAAEAGERLAVIVVRFEAVDAAGRELAEPRLAGGELPGAQRQQTLVEQAVQLLVVLDLVLGICAGRARPAGAAADIPECAQFLHQFGRHVRSRRLDFG